MKKPGFIYFDVGSVLMNNHQGMLNVASRHNVSFDDVYALLHEHWKAGCRGELSNEAYMQVFTDRLGITHPSGEITDFWTDHAEAYKDTHRLVHTLKETYRIGLLSNAEVGMLSKAMKKGLVPDISWDVIIESARHRTIKPEDKIFAMAEDLAGVNNKDLFFIDDVPEYIEAVRKRGWQGMVFDWKNPEKSVADLEKLLLS